MQDGEPGAQQNRGAENDVSSDQHGRTFGAAGLVGGIVCVIL
jgi:hypothetical protein